MQWLLGFCFVFSLLLQPPFDICRKPRTTKSCSKESDAKISCTWISAFCSLPSCPSAILLSSSSSGAWAHLRFCTQTGRNKGETINPWLLCCFLIKISSIGHNKLSTPPMHQNNIQHPEWGFCSRFLRNDNTRSLEGSSSPKWGF